MTQISSLMGYWSHIQQRYKVSTSTLVLLIYKLSCTQISEELQSVFHIKLSMLWDSLNPHTLKQEAASENVYNRGFQIVYQGIQDCMNSLRDFIWVDIQGVFTSLNLQLEFDSNLYWGSLGRGRKDHS